jgi:hypothetical protein
MIMDLKKEISKAKTRLIKQAKVKGISENFGQKEVRKIREAYIDSIHREGNQPDDTGLIDQFDQWCMTFDLSELRKYQ